VSLYRVEPLSQTRNMTEPGRLGSFLALSLGMYIYGRRWLELKRGRRQIPNSMEHGNSQRLLWSAR
jgi:hypothetical protein